MRGNLALRYILSTIRILRQERNLTINIHVGNLSSETAEDDLRSLFEEYGEVSQMAILSGAFSGRSSGIGIVEMPNRSEGQAAIMGLHGRSVHGQNLTVNEARQRDSSTSGSRSGSSRGHRRDSR